MKPRYRRIQHGFFASVLVASALVLPVHAQEAPTTTAARGTEQAAGQPQAENERRSFTLLGQRMGAYVANLKSSIERSIGLAEKQRQKIVQDLLKDIQSIQKDTTSLTTSRTVQDIRTKAQALRQRWQETENRLRYYSSLVVSSQIALALERLDTMLTRIDELITHLEAKQLVTDELRNLRVKFADAVRKAHEEYAAGKAELDLITRDANGRQHFLTGFERLRAAHMNIQDARQTFRALLKELRNALPQQDMTSTSTPQPIE